MIPKEIRNAEEAQAWAETEIQGALLPSIPNQESALAYLYVINQQIDTLLDHTNKETRRGNINGASGAISVAVNMSPYSQSIKSKVEKTMAGVDEPILLSLIEKTSRIPKRCEQATAQITAMQNPHGQVPELTTIQWYANRYLILSTLEAFHTCRNTFRPRKTSQEKRAAYITAAEYLTESKKLIPMDNQTMDHIIATDDGYNTHKVKLQEACNRADRTIEEGVKSMVQQYNREAEIITSPILLNNPDFSFARVVPDNISTIRPNIGFYMGKAEHDEHGISHMVQDPHVIICFIHMGTKITKTFLEPYPPGYPREDALVHIDQAKSHLGTAISTMARRTGIDHEKTHHAFHTIGFGEHISMMESMIHNGMHDIPEQNFKTLLETTENNGLPNGAKGVIINAMSDAHQYSIQLINQMTGNLPTLTQKQAKAALVAAENAGADQMTIAQVAALLGYPNDDDITNGEPYDSQTVNTITSKARELGFPEPVTQRIGMALEKPETRKFTHE